MGLLTGKTALITGAARGIGKAIALKFAEEGANVAFTDLVIDENGKATEAEIAAKGVKAKGYASNAADFAQTEEVVKQVKEEFGSIDILVNNAGIHKKIGLMPPHDRSTVGCRYCSQPEKCLQLHPRLCAGNDASAWWIYHQHGIGSGRSRQCRTEQLRRFQGRTDSIGQKCCSGDGTERNPCQRHRPGIHRHSNDTGPV